jgi:hypothetical protein
MSRGKSSMKWDAQAHEEVLLAICQRVKLSADDYGKIVSHMNAKGYGITENGFRYALSSF